MKYQFSAQVIVAFSQKKFKEIFPNLDPTSEEAEKKIGEFAQQIIDNYLDGHLYSEDQVREVESNAYSAAWESFNPNDSRLRHGPGGC